MIPEVGGTAVEDLGRVYKAECPRTPGAEEKLSVLRTADAELAEPILGGGILAVLDTVSMVSLSENLKFRLLFLSKDSKFRNATWSSGRGLSFLFEKGKRKRESRANVEKSEMPKPSRAYLFSTPFPQ